MGWPVLFLVVRHRHVRFPTIRIGLSGPPSCSTNPYGSRWCGNSHAPAASLVVFAVDVCQVIPRWLPSGCQLSVCDQCWDIPYHLAWASITAPTTDQQLATTKEPTWNDSTHVCSKDDRVGKRRRLFPHHWEPYGSTPHDGGSDKPLQVVGNRTCRHLTTRNRTSRPASSGVYGSVEPNEDNNGH